MSDTDLVLLKVMEAFKAVFDIDPQLLTLDTGAGDIQGWDSLGHLSLTTKLEQTFSRQFEAARPGGCPQFHDRRIL